MNFIKNIVIVISAIFILTGCGQQPIAMVKLHSTSLQERQIQVKTFNTNKEAEILSASVSTLQDMGFNIDEINRDFGVVTCSKTRDAREAGQQIGYFLLAILIDPNVMNLADNTQTIRATVVTTPKGSLKKETAVRLTIIRVLYNQKGATTDVETIKDQKIYQDFFDRLSKSVFLEEQKI